MRVNLTETGSFLGGSLPAISSPMWTSFSWICQTVDPRSNCGKSSISTVSVRIGNALPKEIAEIWWSEWRENTEVMDVLQRSDVGQTETLNHSKKAHSGQHQEKLKHRSTRCVALQVLFAMQPALLGVEQNNRELSKKPLRRTVTVHAKGARFMKSAELSTSSSISATHAHALTGLTRFRQISDVRDHRGCVFWWVWWGHPYKLEILWFPFPHTATGLSEIVVLTLLCC